MTPKFAVAALLVSSTEAFSMMGLSRAHTQPARTGPVKLVAPLADDIWTTSPSARVEGNTLKTWNVGDKKIERVQLGLRSPGRPIEANIELWHGDVYTPTKFRVYTEDGALRPVDAVIETPKSPKTVAVYNVGSMEFPFDATVANTGLARAYESVADAEFEHIQGGDTVRSYTFGAEVDAVAVYLKTAERNMKAKIELTQGPNQVKQYIEMYASAGYIGKNPFYAVIKTPGINSVIRVINQNTVEFPFDAWVVPVEFGSDSADGPVMGGF